MLKNTSKKVIRGKRWIVVPLVFVSSVLSLFWLVVIIRGLGVKNKYFEPDDDTRAVRLL